MLRIRQRALQAAALFGVLAATAAGVTAAPVTASASPLAARSAAVTAGIQIPLTPIDTPLSTNIQGMSEPRHACGVIENTAFITAPGSGNAIEAVDCADVFVLEASPVHNEVFVQNEVYCQFTAGPNKGKTTACSGISEQVGAGSPQGTAALPAQLCGGILGHSPCTSGRTLHPALAFEYEPSTTPFTLCTVWGESLHVTVVLPITGHPRVSETVRATSHLTVSSFTNAFGYCLAN